MTFRGREVDVAGLALTLACLGLVTGWVTTRLSIVTGLGIGYATATAVVLVAGWWTRSRAFMQVGLIASVLLWCYVAAVAAYVTMSPTSALLAGAWLVLAAGSYLTEARRARAD